VALAAAVEAADRRRVRHALTLITSREREVRSHRLL
jgi:hypothetical protein